MRPHPRGAGDRMRTARRPLAGFLLATVLLAPGCAEEWGPEPIPTTTATGRVRIGSRPLRDAWVEFLPTGGTLGRLRSAQVGPDGTFRATELPVGDVVIRLVLARPDEIADPSLRQFFRRYGQSYFIRRTLGPGPNRLDIDLPAEVERLYRQIAPQT